VDMVNLLDDIEKNLPKAKPSEDEDSEIWALLQLVPS
jgi:hypothetical protein